MILTIQQKIDAIRRWSDYFQTTQRPDYCEVRVRWSGNLNTGKLAYHEFDSKPRAIDEMYTIAYNLAWDICNEQR